MSDTGVRLVLHGHFYQPPRENPWTEEVPREASASPAHDWNQRITNESYRPNAHARVVDGRNRVVAIVDNYRRLSFNVGPTLLAWMERNEPEVYADLLASDRASRTAIAQAHGHLILPLCDDADLRTQVRWGLADFRHRFGRSAEAMWLPECGVDERTLNVLAEEGVRSTILAPGQASRVRPLGDDGSWREAGWGIDVRRPYRWIHPDGSGRAVDIVFYDGALSHDVAFGTGTFSSAGFIDRVLQASGGQPGVVAVSTDGETFGHHHRFGERMLAYALEVEAPRRGVEVRGLLDAVREFPATEQVEVHASAWSCAHGLGRWAENCGCSTGGEPGWNQEWRRPLREALDLLRGHSKEVFVRRSVGVLSDPWAARDAYIDVLNSARTHDEFAQDHVIGNSVDAFTLLESQRHAMSMYTSCGWFFNDLSGIETVQVLRYAARVIDLLEELGEAGDIEARVVTHLANARSNMASFGTGADIWRESVVPSRVDAARVVGHIALEELLERREPTDMLGGHRVEHVSHLHRDRGALEWCSGRVKLEHRRTGRVTEHTFAALRLGALEVSGFVRPSLPDDNTVLEALVDAFDTAAPAAELLQRMSRALGPRSVDIACALPEAVEDIVRGVANRVTDRLVDTFAGLYDEHRDTLEQLQRLGAEVPRELEATAELALGRRVERELALQRGSDNPDDYAAALEMAREAKAQGVELDIPLAARAFRRVLEGTISRAVVGRDENGVQQALGLLRVRDEFGMDLVLDRAQELVYEALRDPHSRAIPRLDVLADRLGIAVEAVAVRPSPRVMLSNIDVASAGDAGSVAL